MHACTSLSMRSKAVPASQDERETPGSISARPVSASTLRCRNLGDSTRITSNVFLGVAFSPCSRGMSVPCDPYAQPRWARSMPSGNPYQRRAIRPRQTSAAAYQRIAIYSGPAVGSWGIEVAPPCGRDSSRSVERRVTSARSMAWLQPRARWRWLRSPCPVSACRGDYGGGPQASSDPASEGRGCFTVGMWEIMSPGLSSVW
jgi:hypothetical protein